MPGFCATLAGLSPAGVPTRGRREARQPRAVLRSPYRAFPIANPQLWSFFYRDTKADGFEKTVFLRFCRPDRNLPCAEANPALNCLDTILSSLTGLLFRQNDHLWVQAGPRKALTEDGRKRFHPVALPGLGIFEAFSLLFGFLPLRQKLVHPAGFVFWGAFSRLPSFHLRWLLQGD